MPEETPSKIAAVDAKRKAMTPTRRLLDTIERAFVFIAGCFALIFAEYSYVQYHAAKYSYASTVVVSIIMALVFVVFIFGFGTYMAFMYNSKSKEEQKDPTEESDFEDDPEDDPEEPAPAGDDVT